MKNLFVLAMFSLTCLVFSSCTQEATFTVPSIADQFISFNIDGQAITLNSVSAQAYEPNQLQFSNGRSYLSLSRNSSDLSTTFTITAVDLPLEMKSEGVVILREVFVPAVIEVSSLEMSGSIYCPHPINGTPSVAYDALIKLERVAGENRFQGSFMTDPAATDNIVTITEGKFDLVVPIY